MKQGHVLLLGKHFKDSDMGMEGKNRAQRGCLPLDEDAIEGLECWNNSVLQCSL